MNASQIAGGIILLVLAIGTFVISYFQFKEKGLCEENRLV